MGPDSSPAIFFSSAGDFRAWLEVSHASARELLVGFRRRSSGQPSLTWPEAVDQALCFGWIDGVRRGVEDGYTIRFTPRRLRSNWSAVNVRRFRELETGGLVQPAGRQAFEQRVPERTGIYSYENRHRAELDPAQRRQFQAHPRAWEFFQRQPPGYRTTTTWWVISAKREETRARRLQNLIGESERERRIGLLRLNAK